jgi:hypothetical protein
LAARGQERVIGNELGRNEGFAVNETAIGRSAIPYSIDLCSRDTTLEVKELQLDQMIDLD